jgi:carbon-monoxide dehydrogenase small subunit
VSPTSSDITLTLDVNSEPCQVTVGASTLLIDALREGLGLTGVKYGCGTGDCGSCTAIVDGQAVTTCLIYAAECDAAAIVTPEHVAESASGRILLEEFAAAAAVQCGICIPGFIVQAAAVLEELGAAPAPAAVKDALAGNICRCTGYYPIIAAVRAAATRLAAGEGAL